jgi:hypothetical protein
MQRVAKAQNASFYLFESGLFTPQESRTLLLAYSSPIDRCTFSYLKLLLVRRCGPSFVHTPTFSFFRACGRVDSNAKGQIWLGERDERKGGGEMKKSEELHCYSTHSSKKEGL